MLPNLIVGNGVVVSCGSPAHVIEDGAVAVSGELITDVGPCEELRRK